MRPLAEPILPLRICHCILPVPAPAVTGVARVANAFKNIGLVNWEKQAGELKATLEEIENRLAAKARLPLSILL